MITAKSIDELQAKLEKASKKASQVNPELHIVELGHYLVQSSDKTKFYDVYCGKNEQDEFFYCLHLSRRIRR